MSRYYDDYLCHHGIKGQRWGIRRFQNKDGSYTSAGKTRHSKSSSESSTEKKGLSDKQKTALKVGAATVVAGLAIYGGYKAGRHIKITNEAKEVVKKFADQELKDRIDREIRIEKTVWNKIDPDHKVDTQPIIDKVTREIRAGEKPTVKKLVKDTKQARSYNFRRAAKEAIDPYERAFGKIRRDDPIKTFGRYGTHIQDEGWRVLNKKKTK